jgi:hypothetical protein
MLDATEDVMGEAAVRDILIQIEKLPDADRLLLEQRLAERAEAEWVREAAAARELARQRGIDQAAIDQAVDHARYKGRSG